MKEKIAEHVKELFAREKIKGFVALRQDGEHVGPHLFTDPEGLDELSLGDWKKPGDARYSLVKLLSRLAGQFPNDTFAILVRGCDERAVRQLARDNRAHPLNLDHVVPVGFSCPPELAEFCQCSKPWPDALTAGEPTPGVMLTDDQSPVDMVQGLEQWSNISDRCVKCFGCRNICPVCVCQECTIEREVLVPQRELPPSPSFLMTRAVHMVDRCVFCGLCEQACPANIPLKSMYRFVAKLVGQRIENPALPAGDLIQAGY